MYSFTKPKKKPLFKEDTRLWIIFLTISITLYLIFSAILIIKSHFFKEDTQIFKEKTSYLTQKIEKIKEEKKFINYQIEFYKNILIENSIKKENIKNLLSLIPDPITLTKVEFYKNKLIIYGITPSKDIYYTLMLPPLESVFHITKVNFYQLSNGWYRFKSENILKEEQ